MCRVHTLLALYIANWFEFRHFFCDSRLVHRFYDVGDIFVCQSGFLGEARHGHGFHENAVLFHVPEQLFAADERRR